MVFQEGQRGWGVEGGFPDFSPPEGKPIKGEKVCPFGTKRAAWYLVSELALAGWRTHFPEGSAAYLGRELLPYLNIKAQLSSSVS